MLSHLKDALSHLRKLECRMWLYSFIPFIIGIVTGAVLVFTISEKSGYDLLPYFGPEPYLRAVGFNPGSPFWQTFLELSACHIPEVTLIALGGYLFCSTTVFFLFGEGVELAFVSGFLIRIGHKDWGDILLRCPQFLVGYGLLLVVGAFAFSIFFTRRKGERPDLTRRQFLTILFIFWLWTIVNDLLEAYYITS